LQVLGLDGKNYRLLKDNLDKDIVPEKSRIIVKKNKVVVTLQKVKGTYSYESW
jgi:calcyclin binding protein